MMKMLQPRDATDPLIPLTTTAATRGYRRIVVVIIIITLCAIIFYAGPYLNAGVPLRFVVEPNRTNATPGALRPRGYVSLAPFNAAQGLGNQIFMFSAIFYVALLTNREPVLFHNHNAQTLESVFDLKIKVINETCPCFTFTEEKISYDIRLEKEIASQSARNSSAILLSGLYQSWRYTHPVESVIRPILKFKKHLTEFALNFLRSIVPEGWPKNLTRVGIHNRRGNFAGEGALEFGLTTAPGSYFKRAMAYFVQRFSPVQFIVISQDADWSLKHITFDAADRLTAAKVNVTYSFKFTAGQDMAILSHCDHVIVSTGTFGWWSAWQAKGTTLYYPHYPRNGSWLSDRISSADYFPRDWISID